MLNIATPFPNPGSYATARGLSGTVRILRLNDDGSLLISGEHVSTRSVSLASLRAAAKPKPKIVPSAGEFYVYVGEKLIRVCPSIGVAREVAAGL